MPFTIVRASRLTRVNRDARPAPAPGEQRSDIRIPGAGYQGLRALRRFAWDHILRRLPGAPAEKSTRFANGCDAYT